MNSGRPLEIFAGLLHVCVLRWTQQNKLRAPHAVASPPKTIRSKTNFGLRDASTLTRRTTCATTLFPPVPGVSVWDYAMIGCFFGKKIKQLQSINHRELIKFEDSYKLCHDYFPSPAVDEAFLRQRHFIVRAHFFLFLFFWRMFWRHAPSPGLSEMARKTPRSSTPLLVSRF